MLEAILEKVSEQIEVRGLTHKEAATKIGVTLQSLQQHLNGGYVRSDSLAKYRLWLDNESASKLDSKPSSNSKPTQKMTLADTEYGSVVLCGDHSGPLKPYYVVDLFCGCGGMSMGFDRLAGGTFFKTVLAIDIEEPMIRVFNDNHSSPNGDLQIGRQLDLTDFLNTTEVLAFYLDHLARTGQDKRLYRELRDTKKHNLYELRLKIQSLDAKFLYRLNSIRTSSVYQEDYKKIEASALGQTSVVGFHKALRLPISGKGRPKLGAVIWSDSEEGKQEKSLNTKSNPNILKIQKNNMRMLWESELGRLEEKSTGIGTGQLSSASKRIQSFLEFAESESMCQIKEAWVEWRASREAVRIEFFNDNHAEKWFQTLYDNGRKVSVLLGGPPCQGFSRIGRGKIRSLREQSVHVHENRASVDSRNQLMHQYVLFVSALAPDIFLFENVRHFQAVVKTPDGTFDATEVLAEAIENASTTGSEYSVASQIIYAYEHLVPQKRERFFMAGIGSNMKSLIPDLDLARWVLSPPKLDPIPLEVALEGLPEPHYAERDGLGQKVNVKAHEPNGNSMDSLTLYRKWILSKGGNYPTDGHVIRKPRPDDSAFFQLLGPGMRWMDYRCDKAPTLQQLKNILSKLIDTLEVSSEFESTVGCSLEGAREIQKKLDGSLSLRLLLESIPLHPGEIQHHLLAANYLKKKEGAHGDWLARMDPARPSKTMVSHMGKDTYAYVHPFLPRTISVREAARIQSFPDDYKLGSLGLVDGFHVVGNAVPPLLSLIFAERILQIIKVAEDQNSATSELKAH